VSYPGTDGTNGLYGRTVAVSIALDGFVRQTLFSVLLFVRERLTRTGKSVCPTEPDIQSQTSPPAIPHWRPRGLRTTTARESKDSLRGVGGGRSLRWSVVCSAYRPHFIHLKVSLRLRGIA